MLRLLPVGVWTVKSSSDVVHLIDTHCVAFKNSTVERNNIILACFLIKQTDRIALLGHEGVTLAILTWLC